VVEEGLSSEAEALKLRLASVVDADLLHEVMIDTAATEPLIADQGGDWPSFDTANFLRHALQRVEAEGHAPNLPPLFDGLRKAGLAEE
jgi:hypothetical protein